MTGETTRDIEQALAPRYRVDRLVGQGGMGTVYLADDTKHERRVAVKVLRPELARLVGPERFLREIQVTAQLDHPHIVPLLDSGEADGLLYFVMPYVEGESLRARLVREGPLPLDDAVQIAREVADALSHAHGRGVVHRDIKPENVLLAGGHARVADFGIAQAATTAGGTRLTGTGLAIGTPGYMSPEQAQGGVLDARSDQYSLGCVAYEMLTAQAPAPAPTRQELARPSVLRESVPDHVDAAIARALSPVPADRFATVRAFADALGPIPARRRGRRLIPMALLMAFALLVLMAVVAVRAGWLVRPAAAAFFRPSDQVVVAEFTNDTAEPALTLAVREAVITDLAQTSYARVPGRPELGDVLRRMRLPDTAVIDLEAAVEIARREGYPAVVAGGVTALGAGYQLTARIVEASTGAVAVRLRETARSADDVIPAVERLARRLRRHLGESWGSIRRSDPLPRVTTASLEALQLQARGQQYVEAGNLGAAIPLLEQAVQVDTAFAMAHRALSVLYGNIGNPGAAQEHGDRAFQYSSRLPRGERYLVRALYHSRRGELDSAAVYYRHLLEWEPEHAVALNNLGDLYEWMGRYEDALRLYRRAAAVSGSVTAHLNLASAARTLGHHAVADSSAHIMRERYPDAWWTWSTEAQNAVYAVDEATWDRIAREMSEHEAPFPRAFGRWLRAVRHAMHGDIDAALVLLDSALVYVRQSPSPMFEYTVLGVASMTAVAAGQPARALPLMEAVADPVRLGGAPRAQHRALGQVAASAVMAGDPARARRVLERADSVEHAVTFRPLGDVELVRSLLALRDGRPQEAIARARAARDADFGRMSVLVRLVLADALAAEGQWDVAAAHYDSLTTTRGLNFIEVGLYGPVRPVAHRRAAQAYLAAGDTANAIEHLAAFIELWRDADPALQASVADARNRLAQLLAARG